MNKKFEIISPISYSNNFVTDVTNVTVGVELTISRSIRILKDDGLSGVTGGGGSCPGRRHIMGVPNRGK